MWGKAMDPRGTWLQALGLSTCNTMRNKPMFWGLHSSLLYGRLLDFPTCSLAFSLSGGRAGALLLVLAVLPSPSSRISASWENKVFLSWTHDRCCWWLMQLRRGLILWNQAEIRMVLPTLDTPKLNVSNLKLHADVLVQYCYPLRCPCKRSDPCDTHDSTQLSGNTKCYWKKTKQNKHHTIILWPSSEHWC